MKNSKTSSRVAVLALAFASPAFAKGTSEEARQDEAQDVQRDARAARGEEPKPSGWTRLSRQQVEELQRTLQQRGHYDGSIDGIAGPNTRAAVRNFQQQRGMTANGQLDDETRSALGMSSERQPVRGTEPSERQPGVGVDRQPESQSTGNDRSPRMNAPAGQGEPQHELAALSEEQVREVQVRLQERGYYQGEIDGKIGPATRAALARFFQRQSQLAAQGKMTESALSAFGLDASEIQPVRGTGQPARSTRDQH